MRQMIRRSSAIVAGALLATMALAPAGRAADTVATEDSYQATEDEQLAVAAQEGLLANDNAVTDTCAVLVDDAGLNGTVTVGLDGSFTYTPTANFNGTTSFAYGIRIAGDQTCSGVPDSQATVTITVGPVNDAPTAAADSFGVVRNVTLNVGAPGVLRNDSDLDGDSLTAVKVSNPSHGVVILAADGAFSYTPSTGYVGPDAFSYMASDGSATSPTRVVSLTVTAIPPIATPTPTPIPTPTLTPIQTPQETIPEPSPTAEASPSLEPSPSPAETLAPSASPAPSPSPGSSEAPAPVDDGGGGVSLPVLLVIVLFVLLAGFGAALYVPKWLAAQRGEPPDPD